MRIRAISIITSCAVLFACESDPTLIDRCNGTKPPGWSGARPAAVALACTEGHLTLLALEADPNPQTGARRIDLLARVGTEYVVAGEGVTLTVDGAVILGRSDAATTRELRTGEDGVARAQLELTGLKPRVDIHAATPKNEAQAVLTLALEEQPLESLLVELPAATPRQGSATTIHVQGYLDAAHRYPAVTGQLVRLCSDEATEPLGGALVRALDEKGATTFEVTPHAGGTYELQVCAGTTCDPAQSTCEDVRLDVERTVLQYVLLSGPVDPMVIGEERQLAARGFADAGYQRRATGTARICADAAVLPTQTLVDISGDAAGTVNVTAVGPSEDAAWVAACPLDVTCSQTDPRCGVVDLHVGHPLQAAVAVLAQGLVEGSSSMLTAYAFANENRTRKSPDGTPLRFCSWGEGVTFSPTTALVADGTAATSVRVAIGAAGGLATLAVCPYSFDCLLDQPECTYLDEPVAAAPAETSP